MPDTSSLDGVHREAADTQAMESHVRRACEELSFLVTRGYGEAAALGLVAERHALTPHQRDAVMRAACCDEALRQIELWRRSLPTP